MTFVLSQIVSDFSSERISQVLCVLLQKTLYKNIRTKLNLDTDIRALKFFSNNLVLTMKMILWSECICYICWWWTEKRWWFLPSYWSTSKCLHMKAHLLWEASWLRSKWDMADKLGWKGNSHSHGSDHTVTYGDLTLVMHHCTPGLVKGRTKTKVHPGQHDFLLTSNSGRWLQHL